MGKQIDLFQFPEEKKARTVAAEFVLGFQNFYKRMTGENFLYDRKHFVIAAGLIKENGIDMVMRKTNTLAIMCKNRATWFTRSGWADFSIQKLSNKWNEILPDAAPLTSQQKSDEAIEKWRSHEIRVGRALGQERRGDGAGGTGEALHAARPTAER